MGIVAPAVGEPARAPAQEAPTVQRRFLCPACRQPMLALLHDGGPHVARCEACAWATDDLLTLIPVRPAPLVEVALGRGALAALRIILFVAVLAGALALVVARG